MSNRGRGSEKELSANAEHLGSNACDIFMKTVFIEKEMCYLHEGVREID